MRAVLPFRGEFGLKIRYHVPAVHAMPGPKVVFCERGEEALYPSAEGLHIVDRRDDDDRYGWYATDSEYISALKRRWEPRMPDVEWVETERGMPEERFLPEPEVSHLLDPTIVVCPRWRKYAAARNWPHWPPLTHALSERGYDVHAAGAPESSLPLTCPAAWNYERYLDASIEMMRRADLVVATDSGLAQLAVLCGADLLVVTYRGMAAPGPVIDSSGNVAREDHWRAGWGPNASENRLETANHAGARIGYVDGWEDVDAVVGAVEEWVTNPEAA